MTERWRAEYNSIYMAGPLFTIAERVHNLRLAEKLRELGYSVMLPQVDATRLDQEGELDLLATCMVCLDRVKTCDVIVANIDGPDADSGTCVEVGAALTLPKKPLIICVRTDLRTAADKEAGINGMLQLANAIIILPATVNSMAEITLFYQQLARKIDEQVREYYVGQGS